MLTKKRIPGMKISSALYYILAGVVILTGLFLFILSIAYITGFTTHLTNPLVALLFSIFTLGVGSFFFFVANSLWKEKNWAWNVAFVLTGFQLIFQFRFTWINISSWQLYVKIFLIALSLVVLLLLWLDKPPSKTNL